MLCPNSDSRSPAGMPAGVYEALKCTCTDLNDWPPQYQDGYVIGNVSAVANAYVALAAAKVSEMVGDAFSLNFTRFPPSFFAHALWQIVLPP